MQASAISMVRAKRILMAGEQPRHLLRRFQVPLGIGFELQPCVMDGAFLADAGEHVLQGPAMGGVIEHRIGGDEGYAGARRQLRKRGDAGAIVAAIRVTGGEIEPRLAERLLDATELRFEFPGDAREGFATLSRGETLVGSPGQAGR